MRDEITLDQVLVAPPGEGEVVDPVAWFDSPGPLELEIGCGKGRFLLRRARTRPDVRLLGIEWANKFYRYAADRMVRWEIPNVRLLRTDADHFVKRHLAENCLSALHVYHPDPWPKKRHHKRRLIQPPFVEAAVRATRPGGRWFIQTDHAGYFEAMREVFQNEPRLKEAPFDDPDFGPGHEWEGTNFEVKYLREGRDIFRASFVCLP